MAQTKFKTEQIENLVAADITDFDTEVANNSAVSANTAKVTNATHTGDVTGATALTIANSAVTNAKMANMTTKTYKGRTSGTTGAPEDVAVATLKTDLALVKGDVGLGNVDNTSDANKPVSTAQQTALDLKANLRATPRTASSTTAGTLTPDLAAANVYYRTTQTATLTIEAPVGTPVIGETILIYVDSVGAETLTINAAYKAFGAEFPTDLTAGKTFMLSAQYNGTDWKSLWANAI